MTDNVYSEMAQQVDFGNDQEPSVQLKPEGQAPVTASGTEAALAFSWKAGGYGQANVTVTASDDADGDETYTFGVEAGDAGFANSIVVGCVTIPRGFTGGLIIPFQAAQVKDRLLPDATEIRIGATLGGTSPSVTYSAILGPVVNVGE
jgi:hypothetical protein